MGEYTFTRLTVPAEHQAACNRVAALFDPDTGGARTFGIDRRSIDGTEPATHYRASGAIKTVYLPFLQDAAQALPALQYLAQVYGREQPDPADVETFCSVVIVGDDGLMRVEENNEQ